VTGGRAADWKLWLAAGVTALAVLALIARAIGYRTFERHGLLTPPNTAETPETYGTPYTTVPVPRGTRTLDAWAVDAGAGSAVLVVAHGTNESLSSWADAMALWRRAGVSSFVFDYSGFGRSSGAPRAAFLGDDTRAAYAAARAHFGPNRRYVLVGYSLGTGPSLDVLPSLAPAPDGLALVAGYTSARAGAAAFLKLPSWSTLGMPDLWNNVRGMTAARGTGVPVVVVHSAADSTFPFAMAESVATAGRAALVRLAAATHDEGHRAPTLDYWASVVALAHGRPVLP
jgi:predicted alpha/beta hydrolase family esterase